MWCTVVEREEGEDEGGRGGRSVSSSIGEEGGGSDRLGDPLAIDRPLGPPKVNHID